jgi:hypothetical protein
MTTKFEDITTRTYLLMICIGRADAETSYKQFAVANHNGKKEK